MGIIKKTKTHKSKMRVIIALTIFIAINAIASQAVVPKKWVCCKNSENQYVPLWETKCPGSRRLQGVVTDQYCPKTLTAPKRILQNVEHPVAPNCTNFNGSRRLQAVVTYKCPVNIEGV